MHLLISPPPSPTATSSCCPQCTAVMSIRLVEPDLKDPLKARHVFECQECGLSRAYLMIANQSTRKAPQERSSSLSARLSRSAGLQAPL